MRRVAVAHARVGMVLGRAVYDTRGRLLLADGDKIQANNLGLLARSGSAEVLVDDPRVADVLVGSLYSAQMEAKAVQALHTVLAFHEGGTDGITQKDVLAIQPWIQKMAERLYPDVLGDPELSGLMILKGYDYTHPVKVAGLAMLIGRIAGLTQAQVQQVGIAAILENVGYLSLPPELLEQEGPLSPDEQQQYLHQHPAYGVQLLAESGLEPEVVQAVAQHHERWSGGGYPGGRQGDEISIYARLIALADTYHALLSNRPHRRAFKPHEAVEFIVAFSGDAFDPELAKIFARQVPQYPAGLAVKLSTGEVGIVSDPNAGHIARPVVRICFRNGRAVEQPFDLDLSIRECMSTLIVEVLL